MPPKPRKRIPEKLAAQVVYKANRKCCVCKSPGKQIHHLNGDTTDNVMNNLAYLCLDCHDEAEKKGGLSRKLSPETIILYRDQLYKQIEQERKQAIGYFSTNVPQLSSEDLLVATKNALIILELEKIKERYYNADWSVRKDIINELGIYVNQSNSRIAFEVFSFLDMVTISTRDRMPLSVIQAVHSKVLSFYPYTFESDEEANELRTQIIYMGFNIAYDASIYLKDYKAVMYGLNLIKFAHKRAGKNNVIIDRKVNEIYNDLEQTLQRPERNDLVQMLELTRAFRDDLKNSSLTFPVLPEHLMDILNKEEKVRFR
ncbi:MAG: HNH endonuclease [Flavobacteriales bacterium]